MAAVCTTRKRNELTLKQKYDLIQTSEKQPSRSAVSLAKQFNCGKTQVYSILKNKPSILKLYEENAPDDRCRKTSYCSPFSEVNKLLYEWYLLATRKNVYPDGPLLRQKAMTIADQIGVADFKASNGWIEKWKARYNVKKMIISGESGDVSSATVESWKERLPEILHGYVPAQVWNMDETGCFWKSLPTTGFAEKGKACKGGKASKVRVTIAFFVNALGEKEKPVVIGNSEKPRCFKGVNISQLPVHYYHQPKAWMSGHIMHEVLQKLNRKLISQDRRICLLMDNAGCHPDDICGKFTHIKVVFLPPNTTSVIQPLDLGIIKNFKVYYRKLLLQHIVAKIDDNSSLTAAEIVKSVTLLHAIRWVYQAWEMVQSTTIKKCFRKAGILNTDFSVVARFEANPFSDDMDEPDSDTSTAELECLITRVQDEDSCTAEQFISADNDLSTCDEIIGDDWDSIFLTKIAAQHQEPMETSSLEMFANDDESDHELSTETAVGPRIQNLAEVIYHLEGITDYLDHCGFTSIANEVSKITTSISVLRSQQPSRQSTLDEYFTI